jgi:hypothetical protein
MRTKKTDN